MTRKPNYTTFIALLGMAIIIIILIASIKDHEVKSNVVYTTYLIGRDTVKVNVYGEVIR